jgi:hypothetical protein
MATLKQIEANRLNSQNSTGPLSPEGKAAVRFNALKSGIDAKSQVIPGEDPAALELLTAEYHDRYQPATPEVRALVDTLVTSEWMQRRFRTLEAQLFQFNITRFIREEKGLQAAQAYERDSNTFDRLQRRINAAERSFHRTLVTLQKIESRAPQPPDPDPRPLAPEPEPLSNQPPAPEIGFVPSIPSLVVAPGPSDRDLPSGAPVTTTAPPIPTSNAAEKAEVPMCYTAAHCHGDII